MAQDILIVDDEADIRDLISGILSDEGYTARTASDGLAALDMIKARQPNLVILDVWLGDSERDGLKILDIIKRDHPYVTKASEAIGDIATPEMGFTAEAPVEPAP